MSNSHAPVTPTSTPPEHSLQINEREQGGLAARPYELATAGVPGDQDLVADGAPGLASPAASTPASASAPADERASGARPTRPARPGARTSAACVNVRFDGAHWYVEHPSLEAPAQFDRLDAAEHRGGELARELTARLEVRDQEGAILATYPAPAAPAATT